MQPHIASIPEKKLVGKRLNMSLTNNRTTELWQSFMPCRKEINNTIGTDLFSLRVYDSQHFANFNPGAEFDKWAAIEVSDYNSFPRGLETLTLPAGLYAVFNYVGSASAGGPFFQHIYGTWIPNSEYQLDNRPHFEVLGEKYKNESPDSEEEVWIPVKQCS
jgi:AraC family transcriptional regulator